MDRRKMRSSYAGVSETLPYAIQESRNLQQYDAYINAMKAARREETEAAKLNLMNEESRKDTLRKAEEESAKLKTKQLLKDVLKYPWEQNENLAPGINRIGSTSDDKNKKNSFLDFLDENRHKMWDTVEQKWKTNHLLEMKRYGNDEKIKEYLEYTDSKKAKEAQRLNSAQMPDKDSPGSYWSPFSDTNYYMDAYTTFMVNMNLAQADDYAGQYQRMGEYIDTAKLAIQLTLKQMQLLAINDWIEAQDAVAKYSPNSKNKFEGQSPAAMQMLRNAEAELSKYYKKQNGQFDFNQIWNEKLRLTEETDPIHHRQISNLTIAAQGSGLTGGLATRLMRKLGVIEGDDVTEELESLRHMDEMPFNKRIDALNRFIKSSENKQQKFLKGQEQQEQERDHYANKYNVSDYFKYRMLKGQMEVAEGGSMWDSDYLLFSKVQQDGFSASSWYYQYPAMALSMLREATKGMPIVSGALGVTAAGLEYEAGKAENNSEVINSMKGADGTIAKALKEDGLYNTVMKLGKQKFKGATDEDILEKLANAKWMPEKSETYESIASGVLASMAKARVGSNALFQRDQTAVANQAMQNFFIYGATGTTGLLKGVGGLANRGLSKMAAYNVVKNATKNAASTYAKKFAETSVGKGASAATKYVVQKGKAGIDTADKVAEAIGGSAYIPAAALSTTGRVVWDGTKWVASKTGISEGMLKLARTKAAVDLTLATDATVNFMKKVPSALLGQTGGFITKRAIPMIGDFAVKLQEASYGESIEEGKLHIYAEEFKKNRSDDLLYVDTVDLLLNDLSNGVNLALPALGVPFGIRYGLTNDAELYSEMAGGWLGGAGHHLAIKAGGSVLGKVFDRVNGRVDKNLLSLDHMIASVAQSDLTSQQTMFNSASQIARRISLGNLGKMMNAFNAFREESDFRRQNDLQAVESEVLDEQEKHLKGIATLALSPVIQDQAKANGISVGSKAFGDFVAATYIYKQEHQSAIDAANAVEEQINKDASIITTSQDAAERALESSIYGQQQTEENPILSLFRHAFDKKEQEQLQEEKPLTKKQKKEAERKRKEQEALRKRHIERGGYDDIAEEALEASVGAENTTEQQSALISDDEIVRRGTLTLVQLHTLKLKMAYIKYLLSQNPGTRSATDSEYILNWLQLRYDRLVKLLPEDKRDEVLDNIEAYITDSDMFESLSSKYDVLYDHLVNASVSSMLLNALSGNPTGTEEVSLRNGKKYIKMLWGVSDAKSIIKKIRDNIKSNYDLYDRINQEYKDRLNSRYNESKQQEVKDDAESRMIDEFLSSDETPEEEVINEQPEQTIEQAIAAEPEKPATVQTESPATPAQVTEEEILNAEQHEQAVQDTMRATHEAYKNSVMQQEGASKAYDDETDLLNDDLLKDGDKVVVVNPTTKDYSIYTVSKTENGKAVDIQFQDGIHMMKDGVVLTADEIERLRDMMNQSTTQVQSDVFNNMDSQIEEDNRMVVGRTGHDYFIRERDGVVRMYPRVHTAIGDAYEVDPTEEANYYQLRPQIEHFVRNGELDKLEQFVKSVKGYELYIDLLKNSPEDSEAVIEALSVLMSQYSKNGSVIAGNIADEIVRKFFDGEVMEYSTCKVNIGVNENEYNVDQFISKETFDKLIDCLIKQKQIYDNLGYKISSKRHIWHGQILVDGKYQRIAGETDLVAVDKEGKIHIIDTKTTRFSFRSPDGNKKFYLDTIGPLFGREQKHTIRKQYSRQLSTYMMLIKASMPDAEFAASPLELLPIIVERDVRHIEAVVSGIVSGNPIITSIPCITRMDIGQGEEPARVELDVDEDIVNGVFNKQSLINVRLEQLKTLFNSVVDTVNDLVSDFNLKRELLKQKNEAFAQMMLPIADLLDNISQLIDSTRNILSKPVPSSVEEDNAEANLLDVLNQAEFIRREANRVFSENITKPDEPSVPSVPQPPTTPPAAPTTQQLPTILTPNTPTTKASGWEGCNTADPWSYEQAKAKEDSSVSFVDILTRADFDQQSEAEVVATHTKSNRQGTTKLILVTIRYKDLATGNTYTFEKIEIQAAKTPEGDAFYDSIKIAFANKKKGSRILLNGMNRTAGIPIKGAPVNILNSALVPEGTSWYDISTEYGNTSFGLAKEDKFGKVHILTQGIVESSVDRIYTFEGAEGTPGVWYSVITPSYHNATTPVEPLVMPIIAATINEHDANLLIRLFKTYLTPNYEQELEDGTYSNLPLSHLDLIKMYIPVGKYGDRGNNAQHVEINGSTVTFTFKPTHENPTGSKSFNLLDEQSESGIPGLKAYLQTVPINVYENIANCRMGTSDNMQHPFKTMSKWFKNHPGVNSIQLGQSRIRFGREDFVSPTGDTRGLSGLAWMMKNAIIYTEYAGISNPRFSYTGMHEEGAVLTVLPENSGPIVVDPMTAPASNVDTTDDDIAAALSQIDGGVWHIQNGKAQKTVTKEEAVRHVAKIFGKNVPVEMVEHLTDVFAHAPAGAVGSVTEAAIYLQENAEAGTEYHEAFHRASLLLLPTKVRNELYKGIKKALMRTYGKEWVNQLESKDEKTRMRVFDEFGANMYLRYMLNLDAIEVNWLKHPFLWLSEYGMAFREIGSFRLYLMYAAMNSGLFKLPWIGTVKDYNKKYAGSFWQYQIHGVGFDHIFNDKMYDEIKKSLILYIFKAQGIRKDGKNLNGRWIELKDENGNPIMDEGGKPKRKFVGGLDLSKDALTKRYRIYTKKDGTPGFLTIPQMMLASCHNEVDGLRIPNQLGINAIKEVFEKWDSVQLDLVSYVNELGIDYQERNDEEDEDVLVSGAETLGSDAAWLSNHEKADYEKPRTAKATTGIRFFTSMIKDGCIDPVTGNFIDKHSELGYLQFMDSHDVQTKLLGDLHRVKSISQLKSKMQELAKTDYMYAQILAIISGALEKQNNADNEQFLTQIFNYVCSQQNNFKRLSATRKKDGTYDMTVEDCGQEYESFEYRKEWGRLLAYGGTSLFGRNEQGNVTLKTENAIRLLGSIYDKFDEIKQQFTSANILRLSQGGVPTLTFYNPILKKRVPCNITTEAGQELVIRKVCEMFNYIGIQFDVPELKYLLDHKYKNKGLNTRLDQLNAFFNATGFDDIQNLWSSEHKIIVYDKTSKQWRYNLDADNRIVSGKPVSFESVYNQNSFATMLSDWKYKYQHSTSDLSVLVSGGNTYYSISDNNTISDITDEVATGGEFLDQLSKFCYNYFKSTFTDDKGRETVLEKGSIIIKKGIDAKRNGQELPLEVNTLVQFKTNAKDDDGAGYFDISEREDYVAKFTILEQGGLIFPTMSDKKTWVYLTGITLPGINYTKDDNKTILADNISIDGIIDQLLEYAETEKLAIEQCIEELKHIPEEEKVTNYHKGIKKAIVTDKNGVKHDIPGGTVFASLTGIYKKDKNGEEIYVPFNRVLDDKGNFVSAEDRLQTAIDEFYSKSDDEKKALIKKNFEKQVQKELDKMEELGLIAKNQYGIYENKGLNDRAITAIAKKKYGVANPNPAQKSYALIDYVNDVIGKGMLSIHEVEHVYSGHPGFFLYQFDSTGRLVNRSVDEFKRLGGLISTGTNNNTEFEGAPEDGMYTCTVINNEKVGSEQLEYVTKLMSEAEWRSAYRQLLLSEKGRGYEDSICDEVNNTELEEIKEYIKKRDKENKTNIYAIISNKVAQETSSYESGIDVADGAAYISPEMTEWLLRMCGCWDKKIQAAFKILKNPDKYNIASQAEAYKAVTTKVIGAQKYTAYGQRMSKDGKTMIPYYNKMALFPVFKCVATGKFAKIYDQMQNNKDAQGNPDPIHMMMIQSAIKLGDLGTQDHSVDENFRFNTYKQPFKFLRKQFNTDGHHKEDQSMGTLMVKVALASLIAGESYTMPDGVTTLRGRELLDRIMNDILQLTNIGKNEVESYVCDENGNIDPKKLSKFLNDELSSRDSDKSILDSIQAVEHDGVWMLKHPLAAISRMGWLLSILTSFINKRIVEVHTDGNAFYQRSVWGMEGKAASFMSDENLPEDINGGENLKMIIEDGPAKGAMDCVLTIDYFHDVLKEAGLENASFEEQRKALMDAGIIGKKARANTICYRIPTQALSSIHALRCVDVLPVLLHQIIMPKEFTKITGSDFDIDKLFIASIKYKLTKTDSGYTASEKHDNYKYNVQNDLINCYVTTLTHPNGMHIANRSIDNDTDLILDVVADLESNKTTSQQVLPYDFYSLSLHTSTKNDFVNGKSGIGPYALNNNSHILTMLYNVTFNADSVMSLLGHERLDRATDDDNLSILSWISALINAHVDIAKDPYISKLNVNPMTHNLVNLLIRTGYGKRTFYFTKQPVMIKMAEKYKQAQGKFLQDKDRSSWEIRKSAKKDAAIEIAGQSVFDEIEKFADLDEQGRPKTKEFIELALSLLNGKDNDVLHTLAKTEKPTGQKFSVNGKLYTDYELQAIVYFIDKMLETPAQSLSDLVKYSKIDTKKQGKNIPEQLAYIRGVERTFGDRWITENLFGNTDTSTLQEGLKNKKKQKQYAGEFEFDSIQRMYEQSFIGPKTRIAVYSFMRILRQLTLEGTPGFLNLADRICKYLGKHGDKAIASIQQAMASKFKMVPILRYANQEGINVRGLVSGNNTIYDRLNIIKCKIMCDPKYSDMVDVDGSPKNALLKLLISDKSWEYDHRKHTGHDVDRFENLKFVRLFDALDKSTAKTDYIIQAWDDLLNDGAHKDIQEFARDLCVYAYVTSGDTGGKYKIFNYVPNSFREKSGYVLYIRELIDAMLDGESFAYKFSVEAFTEDLVANNWNDSTFVQTIDPSNKNYQQGDVKWVEIKRNANAKGKNGEYIPSYPVFITADANTPMYGEDIPTYVKVNHLSSRYDDDSSRSHSVYKLVAIIPSSLKEGYGLPVYSKINTSSYYIGGYSYYEYNMANTDTLYIPDLDVIRKQIKQIHNQKELYEQTYGSIYFDVVDAIVGYTGEEVRKTEDNVDVNQKEKTYDVPSINIYASAGENADLSNFAIRPFDITDTFIKNDQSLIHFQSVEQAFLAAKLYYTELNDEQKQEWLDKILSTTDGKLLRTIGRQIPIKDVAAWDKAASMVMHTAIYSSFKNNPNALKRLLDTGTAELTHNQDKSRWKTEFPKILMLVREELRQQEQQSIESDDVIENMIQTISDKMESQYESYTENNTVWKKIPEGYESDSSKMLDFIIKNSKNLDYVKFAEFLKKILTKNVVKITFTESAGGGIYDSSSHTITMNPKMYKPTLVLLHELAHAVTAVSMDANPQLKELFKQVLEHVKKHIAELELKADPNFLELAGIYYGTHAEDSTEFVAEFMSNPVYQELMKQIPAMEPKKFDSLFEQLIDMVKRIFRSAYSPKHESGNLYDQVEPMIRNIINLLYANFDQYKALVLESVKHNTDTVFGKHETLQMSKKESYAVFFANWINRQLSGTPVVRAYLNKQGTYSIKIVMPSYKNRVKQVIDNSPTHGILSSYIKVEGTHVKNKSDVSWNKLQIKMIEERNTFEREAFEAEEELLREMFEQGSIQHELELLGNLDASTYEDIKSIYEKLGQELMKQCGI